MAHSPTPTKKEIKVGGTRPSKAQVAESQQRALREANLFTSPQRQTYLDPEKANSDLSVDQSSGSSSPSALGPELTPRTTDDL
ncbi:hypothetical protein NDU88_003163 [Pleurodeles waltl]|uniref:Uncharacterized protein n=1 Tax=Pleurodeles waltl TaxID=8319 RepID=A0AAV7UCZ3_PLEWA|nr:hypothetical protein NDU88_003163 [Pleurodeles waltl]